MCLANEQTTFIGCLHKLVPYMQGLWYDTSYRTKNIVSLMIGLLGDLLENIVSAMDKEMTQQFLDMAFVKEMLDHGMYKSPNLETRKIATWANSQLQALK